jgi:hypothetical protein
MDPLFRWVLAGVFLVSSPFAAIGVYEAVQTSSELERGVRAQGTVVENRLVSEQREGNEEHAYLPVVEYRDQGGNAVRFTDGAGSLPPDYAVGERVELSFDPTNPSRARIVSWKRSWLVPTILIVAGLLPSTVCALIFWRIARANAR